MPKVPKVAIITRTHNRPDLLRRAVKSVLGQSCPDWQHVIINDGGDPKGVDDLCAEFADPYGDRLVILHTDHKGMQDAANTAIGNSNSTYIVIHDDDDSWHPEFLKDTTEFLDREGPDSDYQGVISRTLRVLEKEDGKGGFDEIERKPYVPIKEVSIFRAGYENPFPPIAFLYRRSAHKEIGLFDPRWDMVADLDFNLRFLQRYEIGVVARPLAYYHWREASVSGRNANTVTLKQERHGRHLNELKNHYMRQASSAKEAAMALGLQLSSFSVENQWMTTEIRERSNEAVAHLKTLIGQVEALHEFNNEELWPKMTGDILRKLNAIIESSTQLEQLRALLSESTVNLSDIIIHKSDALIGKSDALIGKSDKLQFFNDEALWPKLTEDIIPRLDHLVTLTTSVAEEMKELLASQLVFQDQALWPKLEDFSTSIQYLSRTIEAIWEKQGKIAGENTARSQSLQEEIHESRDELVGIREEIRQLREQAKRQIQLGPLRLQWLTGSKKDRGPDTSDK